MSDKANASAEHAQLIEQVIRCLQQINVHGDQFVARLGSEHGLHRTDLNAVSHIARAENQGEPLSPGQLAERLNLGASATTSVVDRLVKVGHIQRTPHNRDRRRTELTLRTAAREEVESFFAPLGVTWRSVAATFTVGELSVVLRFLTAMDESLRELHVPDRSNARRPASPS